MDFHYKIKSMLFGIAIGDALGVPVEFNSREELRENPVEDMIGYGTYNKPPGFFSDDSSLTFALVESLIKGYDLGDIAQNFVKWVDEGFWTPDGEVFDIGNTTLRSIYNFKKGAEPTLSGEFGERSNGNGSLMRIAPLLFIIYNKSIAERFQMIKEVSSITHAHSRSVIACFYLLEFLRYLLKNNLDKFEIYHKLQEEIPDFLDNYFKENDFINENSFKKIDYSKNNIIVNNNAINNIFNEINLSNSINTIKNDYDIYLEEITYFNRLLKEDIYELDENEIKSGGYVIDTLEASVWCLLTTNNYRDAVLKAVNLGYDTDTTAAVTGALAGLLYGFDDIPKEWVEKLARSEDIDDLSVRYADSLK